MQKKMIDLLDSKAELTLIYRATRDGFDRYNFRKKVINKPNLFIIVLNDDNKVFGGYTPIALQDKFGQYCHNGSSFLYSVRDNNDIVKCPHMK